MKCSYCRQRVNAGQTRCPSCGRPIQYGGNTEFFSKAAQSNLRLKDLFSEAFKKHRPGSGYRIFMAGTPATTPIPEQMLQMWDKPWLFVRVLGVGLLFALMSYFMWAVLGHSLGMILLLTLCGLIAPLGILTFFWEINIPRDIPIYRVLVIFLIGGILSLIFTLVLSQNDYPAYLAPLTEEPGKILALAIFLYSMNTSYIFDGLLIGAAVGAGFAAFENVYYAAHTGVETMLVRSILCVGGHVTWAAIEGGALAWVKGRDRLAPRHLADRRFLSYLLAAMGLHCVWNTSFGLFPLPLVVDLKYLLLSAAAVALLFRLIKAAIAQVLDAVNAAELFSTPRLTVLFGPQYGRSLSIQSRLYVGRDPAQCSLSLPSAYVSQVHCVLEARSDGVYLMDLDSHNGTFISSPQGIERIPPKKWVRVFGNFYLGSREAALRVS